MNFAQRNWTNQQHFGSVTNHLHSYIEIMSSASESVSFLLHNLSVMSQIFFFFLNRAIQRTEQTNVHYMYCHQATDCMALCVMHCLMPQRS